ncbi:MAG: choice-of-anchor D domain-containing protein [Blastocatellales bacterium]
MYPAVARIFVSSTWIDLQPERSAVEDAVHRMSEAKFIGMEYFGSRPETTEAASLDEVDRADIYLGIIGGRYGSGITEQEYRRALDRGLPCFIYIKDDSAIPPAFRDTDREKSSRLAALKEELYSRHIICPPFTSPQDLAAHVRDDLHRWFYDNHLHASLETIGSMTTRPATGRTLRLESGNQYGSVLGQGMPPRLTEQMVPLRPNVRPFKNLLDRNDEIRVAIETLSSLSPVQFYGEDGIGKTSLLRRLAYEGFGGAFPDGAIFHHQAGRQTADDLLQFIFESFYESQTGYKPTAAERLPRLRDKRALILMDDIESGRADIEDMINALPGCAFLLAGAERVLFGEGRALRLEGLPEAEAVKLLENELGREIAPDEAEHARAVCAALKGHPLSIAHAAGYAVEQKISLADLARRVGPEYARPLSEETAEGLHDDEKRLLALLTALGGTPLDAESIERISGLRHAERSLEDLARSNLAELTPLGWRISAIGRRNREDEAESSDWRRRAIGYFSDAVQRRGGIERTAPALLACLDWAEAAQLPREALTIGRAVEPALETAGRWDAAQSALETLRPLADAAEDIDAGAWIRHQQGTLAACRGDDETARRLLTEALEQRIKVGDHISASVTRHNLDHLFPPVGAVNPKKMAAGRGRMPAWVRYGLIALLSAGALVGGKTILDRFASQPSGGMTIQPQSLDFGRIPAGGESAPQTLEIINSLADETAISDVRITGNERERFRIIENRCFGMRLRPGESCGIVLIYSSEAPAQHRAELEIVGPGSLTVGSALLAGETVATEITEPTPEVSPTEEPKPTEEPTVQPTPLPGRAIAAIEPAGLNFGRVNVGEISDRAFSIANRGDGDLEIGRIEITGQTPGRFAIIENGCAGARLRPGGNCRVAVRFAPREAGIYGASLIVTDNSDRGPSRVPIEGAGTAPDTARLPDPERRPPARPRLDAKPDSIDFGEQRLRTISRPERIRVRNSGDGLLRIDSVRIIGDDTGFFRIDSDRCSGTQLAADSSCDIGAVFIARNEGDFKAEIEIRGDSQTRRVKLRGAVARPERPSRTELRIEPENIRFGDLPVGGTSNPATIRIANTGDTEVSLESIRITGSEENEFRLRNECRPSLAPNRSCTLSVAFSPRDAGQRTARIEISSNAGRFRIALSGQGLAERREPAGWCCLDGNLVEMDRRACVERKGAFYEDRRTATLRCRPIDRRPTDRQPPQTPKPRDPGSPFERRPAVVSNCQKAILSWSGADDPSGPVSYTVRIQVNSGGWRDIRSAKTERTSLPAFDGRSRISTQLVFRWSVNASDSAGNSSEFSPYLYFTCGQVIR